jgi:hypothetical protein
MENTMSIQLLIDSLKEKGMQVYGPEELTTYVWFTDGKNIGYAQYRDMEGCKYSTVHYANKYTGTGFHAQDAQAALGFAPHWASQSDRSSVIKYRDFAEFQSKHWQPLVSY